MSGDKERWGEVEYKEGLESVGTRNEGIDFEHYLQGPTDAATMCELCWRLFGNVDEVVKTI